MKHYKVQTLSEADITRLENASDKGASAAKEIRGLRKDIAEAGDHGIAELTDLHTEMDDTLHSIFNQLAGKPGKSIDEVGKKVRIKARMKAAAAKRVAEKGVASGTRTRARMYANAPQHGAAKKTEAPKPKKNQGPLRGAAKMKNENKTARAALLQKTENRSDLRSLSEKEVLAIARQFTDLRVNVRRDENTASKQRVSATPENLIRWMRNPGGFDLVGIDSARATTPTADLKMDVGSWFKRFVNGNKD